MNSHKNSAREYPQKLVEIVKDIVIVLLIASALFLGWQSQLFGNTTVGADGLAGLLRGLYAGPESSPDIPQIVTEPSRPVAIALTNGSGGHYGVKYNMEELDEIYEKTALFFTEALGTAQAVRVTDEASWQSALISAGVYFEYLSPVRLSILGNWLGANIAGAWGETSVRLICVTENGEKSRLFFRDDATGEYYTADTSVRGDISDTADDYAANNAVFAFEKWPESNAPSTLLIPDVIGHPQVEAENPLSDKTERDKVLLSLGVSDLTKSSEYFVRDEFTLEISTDGTINYYWTGNEDVPGGTFSESDAVAKANQMVTAQLGKHCGDAAVYYDSSRALNGGGYQVLFRYVVAGGAVWLYRDGFAASVTLKDGRITEMTLRFRSYTALKTETNLLPEIQAAAATDGDFMLGYDDSGDGVLLPIWVNLPLGS